MPFRWLKSIADLEDCFGHDLNTSSCCLLDPICDDKLSRSLNNKKLAFIIIVNNDDDDTGVVLVLFHRVMVLGVVYVIYLCFSVFTRIIDQRHSNTKETVIGYLLCIISGGDGEGNTPKGVNC